MTHAMKIKDLQYFEELRSGSVSEHAVYVSKANLYIYILLSVIITAVAAYFVTKDGLDGWDAAALVAGLIAIAGFGLKLRSSKPLMRISKSGIYLSDPNEVLPWNMIDELSFTKVYGKNARIDELTLVANKRRFVLEIDRKSNDLDKLETALNFFLSKI